MLHRMADRDTSVTDDLVCFALYAASRSVTAVYRPLLERLDLTYPQYLVMMLLWHHGESGVKELGSELRLDYGTVTPLLKRLETLGYLRRQRRVDDERAVRVSLTEAGAALRERAGEIPLHITEALGLTTAQTATLLELLGTIIDNTTRYADSPPARPASEPRTG